MRPVSCRGESVPYVCILSFPCALFAFFYFLSISRTPAYLTTTHCIVIGRVSRIIIGPSLPTCTSQPRSPARVFVQDTLMDPPTYDEATSPSSAVAVEGCDVCPPPSYYASISHSVNPPPYQETNPFPVLMPTIFSPPQTSPVSIHLTPLEAVVSQPASEQTLAMANLLGSPGNVQCPHCRRDVVTNIKQMPGKGAFTLCCILAFSGLVCGFCLVPFMIPDLWDVHHYCPHCGKHLHVHHKS
ncbi:lipopolysaccharide-induced tumor necrosis factor-alpha factor homolog isoform X2 [Phyllopteryx taeniolatus]|uniref:lipopolysaccharide-induced tumor necrosis factor-alpha factor homolog isoform X2 n=1 Tax=Phyllopteryx taeniolatus TaxID=161469 RepID=UPI002AD2B37D|nr:lipopolysaccharide-induced tumor necrosis factor-alpha factor homolog isoform X2 [Phyllopteryx taeniolatus]